MRDVVLGLLIPLAGTVGGAGCVFFMRRALNDTLQRVMTGFASGVMVAASVWSLLIPSMERSRHLAKWAFAPAAAIYTAKFYYKRILDEKTFPEPRKEAVEAELAAAKKPAKPAKKPAKKSAKA